MSRKVQGAVALGLAVVLVGLLAATGAPVAASTPADPASVDAAVEGRSVRIAQLDGVLEEDGTVGVTVDVRNDDAQSYEDLRLRLSVHEVTRSRFALARAVDASEPGPVRAAVETDGTELEPGDDTSLRLRADAGDLGLGDRAPGVYPMTVSVLHGAEALEEYVTALVVPPPGGEPLRVSVLFRFRGPIAMRDGAPYDPSAIEASAQRAQRLARALDAGLPATVAVDGRTIDELRGAAGPEAAGPEATEPEATEPEATEPEATEPEATDSGDDAPGDPPEKGSPADALEVLTGALERPEIELVGLPYGPADLVALVGAGMADEAQHLVERGRIAAEELAGEGSAHASTVVPPRGLDAAAAGWLSGVAGATVLSEGELGLALERELPATPPAVRSLAGIPGLRVAVPDPLLAEVLSRTDPRRDPALTAQRVLAESAAIFFERPGGSTPRGLLLEPSLARTPDLLPALAPTVSGASWLEFVPLSTLISEVPTAVEPETLEYGGRQRQAELPAEYLATVREAREALDPLGEILGEEVTADLSRRLDAAAAVGFRSATLRPHGEAIARSVLDRIDDVRRSLAVEDGPPLTITGVEGALPITVSNAGSTPLNVRVRVVTPRYAVEDEGGRHLELLGEDQVTTTFDVEALAPGGTYPVLVEVTDPSGRMELATGQVAVRSTAFSVTGVTITGGAALLLVGWAIHGLVRRRGADREGEGTTSGEAGQEAGAVSGGGDT